MPISNGKTMSDVTFGGFTFRVVCCHVVTYFVAGVLAFTLLDYKTLYQSEGLSELMRPTSSSWVAAGPALQVVRGVIFAIVLYPFRQVFLREPRGWLKLWGLLVGLAILSTAGPSPGSFEGLVYTKIPVMTQLVGLPEVMLQTLAFSVLLVAWHRMPHRAWGVVMVGLTGLVILMSTAGAVLPRPATFE